MRGGKRKGAGRKRVVIDLAELEKLCAMQCTEEELAAWFQVTPQTIARRRRRDGVFAVAIKRGRAKGPISMRRLLHQQAIEGKPAATMFLAKNLFGNGDTRTSATPCGKEPKKFEGTMEELLQLYKDLTSKEAQEEG
jgi:hypothetical protein